jgi:hypothetical protein
MLVTELGGAQRRSIWISTVNQNALCFCSNTRNLSMAILINHDYYVAELHNNWPPAEMFEWLMLRFGAGDGTRWWYKPPKLYFADKRDHMMFLLRWG